jgi:uridine kinase
MKGDILILDEHHRRAGKQVVERILSDIKAKETYTITVAGESGAGKSEIAQAIKDELQETGISCFIFGQDDYFKLPPKSNARQRELDITWVGDNEVRLKFLAEHMQKAREKKGSIIKPLVDFDADVIGTEEIDFSQYQVFIAEGTYTTLLTGINLKVFINRNKMDTMASRLKRNREKQDDFLDQILTIEHKIISSHKSMADIVIDKEFNVE